MLIYRGVKLAVVEAKSDEMSYSEGVAQAKEYADMLGIRYTYATNGDERIKGTGFWMNSPNSSKNLSPFISYFSNSIICFQRDVIDLSLDIS